MRCARLDRLLQAGLTPKQAVIFMYVISAMFGAMALVFKGAQNKLFAIILMLAILLWLGFAVHKEKKRNNKHAEEAS